MTAGRKGRGDEGHGGHGDTSLARPRLSRYLSVHGPVDVETAAEILEQAAAEAGRRARGRRRPRGAGAGCGAAGPGGRHRRRAGAGRFTRTRSGVLRARGAARARSRGPPRTSTRSARAAPLPHGWPAAPASCGCPVAQRHRRGGGARDARRSRRPARARAVRWSSTAPLGGPGDRGVGGVGVGRAAGRVRAAPHWRRPAGRVAARAGLAAVAALVVAALRRGLPRRPPRVAEPPGGRGGPCRPDRDDRAQRMPGEHRRRDRRPGRRAGRRRRRSGRHRASTHHHRRYVDAATLEDAYRAGVAAIAPVGDTSCGADPAPHGPRVPTTSTAPTSAASCATRRPAHRP